MIHRYKLNNFNILLDVNSRSVYSLSDFAFDFFDFLEKIGKLNRDFLVNLNEDNIFLCEFRKNFSKDELSDLIREVKHLIDLNKFFSKVVDLDHVRLNSNFKSLCLNISHACNLRCRYCFAKQGSFGGKPLLMNLKVAKSAVDFLIRNSGNQKNIEIDFFGGEPLLNFDVLKNVVIYAKVQAQSNGKNLRFTITTNGVLLDDEVIEFINNEIDNVVLSLDGRKNVHDYMRRSLSGNSSFDVVVPKFLKLVNARGHKNYYIRGTFTKNNLDFSKDLLEIYKLGFKRVSLEPVVLPDCNEYAICEEDLPIISKEYESIARSIFDIKRSDKFDFFHFMIDLKKSPCYLKLIKGCGCGVEYLAITPEGDVYPCHQFVGVEKFKLGNITTDDNFFFAEKLNYEFLNYKVLTSVDCKLCWAKYFCGGGCFANNWNFNSNLNDSYKISCKLEKKRVECALMLQIALGM